MMTSINNNYNNYSTNYLNSLYGSNSSSSTYAASKESLYNSLIGQYGQNTATGLSSDMQSYLSTIKTAGSSLKNLLSQTMNKTSNDTLYNQKTIASSNSDILSTSSKSYSVKEKDSLLNTTIKVEQIAQGQKNEGAALSTSSLTIGSGFKSMVITDENNKSYTFSANPLVTQTDQTVQSQLAEKINKANIGITATVEVDKENNTSKLVLSSDKTGENSGFSVSGNLAEALGVSEATTQAQNAIYSVNGAQKTSETNSIKVNDVSMTLNKASSEAVTFTEKPDNSNLVNAVRDIVNNFNKMMSAAEDNLEDSGAEKLYNSLSTIANTYGNALSKAGISLNENGYLEIDEKKMNEAAENGSLQQLVGKDSGYLNYGFASRLDQLTTKVSNDPMNFLSSEAKKTADQSSYLSEAYNSRKGLSAAAFAVNLNRYYNTGLLFESMF